MTLLAFAKGNGATSVKTAELTSRSREPEAPALTLGPNSRVAVVGGGPAGSFFSYFFLETAARLGTPIPIDIYEPKTYCQTGPAHCNMCGGIVSESLVQMLGTEGISLPPNVVQRGIDSYVMHMDAGSVRINPPGRERRIAAVHRGCGPRGVTKIRWDSFDGHLLALAAAKGARVVHERVESITWVDGKPCLGTKTGQAQVYDLVVAAVGVSGPGIKLFESLGAGYVPPRSTKTFICEFHLGEEAIEKHIGSSMHVFLLNVPRLKFAALIPKGEFVTVVLLGEAVDKELVAAFLNTPEFKRCMPPGWSPPNDFCRCFPFINVRGCPEPFSDRLVFVGDCGESRLYKDGIGGAYRTAKAAARTAIFEGVSAEAFRRHYLPVCRNLAADNRIGKLIFAVTSLIQKLRWTRRGLLHMVAAEQQASGGAKQMSGVLWDTFTGSAPYRDVFLRTLHPWFLVRLLYHMTMGFFARAAQQKSSEHGARTGELGKVYRAGETIVRQGDTGDCMFVIQSGKVEVITDTGGQEVLLAELGEGDFFGEMALFDNSVRSATVRAQGEVRALTVDKKLFLRKVHEDPSLAFRIMQRMAHRIRELDSKMAQAD